MRRRIALVLASPREDRGFPLPERVAYLRERGWDAHLVDGRAGSDLRSLVSTLRPELVHFHSAAAVLRATDLKAVLRGKLLVTLTGEDLNMLGVGQPHYYRELWQVADLLHLPAESLWSRALQRGCDPDRRRFVIGPAADTRFFEPRDGKPAANGFPTSLRILSVGPLVWAQGYEHALQAVRVLLDRGVEAQYRIVGEGELLPALIYARSQLGLDDRVELLEPGSRQDLRCHFRWADVFLNAAVAEGFIEAIAEAHAAGLPVVATERGLLDGPAPDEATLVAPSRDPDALAEQLLGLARDPMLRHRLGTRARARALSVFDLSQQLRLFEERYREAALTRLPE